MKKIARVVITFVLISSSILLLPAVYAQAEEYYAVIDELDYPSDVETGRKVSITVSVDYKVPGAATLFVEVFDESDNTLDAEAEEITGEGSKQITLSFNAPSEVDEHQFKVITYFMVDDEVTFVDDGSRYLTIDVLESGGSGASDVAERLGVPGFQPLALFLGLVAVALVMNTKPRRIHLG